MKLDFHEGALFYIRNFHYNYLSISNGKLFGIAQKREEGDLFMLYQALDGSYCFAAKSGQFISINSKNEVEINDSNNLKNIKFDIISLQNSKLAIKSKFNKKYLCSEIQGTLICKRQDIREWELFNFIYDHRYTINGSIPYTLSTHDNKILTMIGGEYLSLSGSYLSDHVFYFIQNVTDGSYLIKNGDKYLTLVNKKYIKFLSLPISPWSYFIISKPVLNEIAISSFRGRKFITVLPNNIIHCNSAKPSVCSIFKLKYYSNLNWNSLSFNCRNSFLVYDDEIQMGSNPLNYSSYRIVLSSLNYVFIKLDKSNLYISATVDKNLTVKEKISKESSFIIERTTNGGFTIRSYYLSMFITVINNNIGFTKIRKEASIFHNKITCRIRQDKLILKSKDHLIMESMRKPINNFELLVIERCTLILKTLDNMYIFYDDENEVFKKSPNLNEANKFLLIKNNEIGRAHV